MRRITLWFLSTLSALVLLLSYHTSLPGKASTSIVAEQSTEAGPAPTTDRTGSVGSGDASAGAGARTSGPSSSTSDSSSSAAASSSSASSAQTLTGQAVQTRYGPVQVEVTLTGDQVTDVQVLQVPWSNGHDQQINGYAVPVLIQETHDADSAEIDMVSGATFTSQGYIQSLQSALDQA